MPLVVQGAWKPRQIDNPDYKGEWEHPQIDNPEYSPDDKLYFYEDSGYVGFDLWQVNASSILLSNLHGTHFR